MIHKTQSQSFGALRLSTRAKQLKGVQESFDSIALQTAKANQHHHFFVDDPLLDGRLSITAFRKSKVSVANWIFEKFPRMVTNLHKMLRRSVSVVSLQSPLKSTSFLSRFADGFEKKFPKLKANHIKKATAFILSVASLGLVKIKPHLGDKTFSVENASWMLEKAVIPLTHGKKHIRNFDVTSGKQETDKLNAKLLKTFYERLRY